MRNINKVKTKTMAGEKTSFAEMIKKKIISELKYALRHPRKDLIA
jgi:hypothetical protein